MRGQSLTDGNVSEEDIRILLKETNRQSYNAEVCDPMHFVVTRMLDQHCPQIIKFKSPSAVPEAVKAQDTDIASFKSLISILST